MDRLPVLGSAALVFVLLTAPSAAAPPESAPLAGATTQAAPAQPPAAQEPPEPLQGQAGKDVIYMPTPESLVERMLTMAQVTARDVVYDLGSGDGRTVLAAARRGARAIGIEYNPELVAFSQSKARALGLSRNARFVQGDIFETPYSDATVVTLYLLSTLNMRLRPTLLELRPGTRVVSHAFSMEDWTPDEVSRAEQRTAYLWIVPAAVEGSWHVELEGGRSFEMAIGQKFQKLEGTVALGSVEAGLREASLRGDTIRFGFVDQDGALHELAGTVDGARITGSCQSGGRKRRFTATKR